MGFIKKIFGLNNSDKNQDYWDSIRGKESKEKEKDIKNYKKYIEEYIRNNINDLKLKIRELEIT